MSDQQWKLARRAIGEAALGLPQGTYKTDGEAEAYRLGLETAGPCPWPLASARGAAWIAGRLSKSRAEAKHDQE